MKFIKISDGTEIRAKEVHFFPDGGLRKIVDFEDNSFSYSEVKSV